MMAEDAVAKHPAGVSAAKPFGVLSLPHRLHVTMKKLKHGLAPVVLGPTSPRPGMTGSGAFYELPSARKLPFEQRKRRPSRLEGRGVSSPRVMGNMQAICESPYAGCDLIHT